MGKEKKPIQPNPEFRENLGKLLLDLSKLTFASFILGGILKGDLPQYKKEQGVIMWLIVFMAVCSVPLIVMGCVCLWRENQWEKYNESKAD